MFFHKNDEGEKKETEGKRGKVVPLLPLRDIIVFPHMVVPLFVGREKSINALEEAMSHEKEILLAAQKKAKTNDPTPDDIFQMGTDELRSHTVAQLKVICQEHQLGVRRANGSSKRKDELVADLVAALYEGGGEEDDAQDTASNESANAAGA